MKEAPRPPLPEVAFIGRSNVGKSSLLNALFNRKNLAHTSAAPGKTRLLNYFLVNDQYYFVDLPGYGYAKLSREIRKSWPAMIETYLLNNHQLQMICLLIDARHSLQNSDEEMITWLHHHEKPFFIVLTKWDKLSQKDRARQLKHFHNHLPDHHLITFSIRNETYRDDLRKFLLSLLINKS